MIKFKEEVNLPAFENMFGYLFISQSKIGQPIYLITRIQGNKFTTIECFTTEGEIDLGKIRSVYNERYSENKTKRRYEIIELNLKDFYNPLV